MTGAAGGIQNADGKQAVFGEQRAASSER
jgi:hypothetical protein